MGKTEKRKEFLSKLKDVKSLMNWCKLKINPDETENVTCDAIAKDYVCWEAEQDDIFDKLRQDESFKELSTMDKILKLHNLVCEHFVFDDFCYFLGSFDKDKNICTIDEKYGRNPSQAWKENRKKNNKRICYELSRYMAVRLKEFVPEATDIFLVSDEYETHYATAFVCDDFMIIIDTDDYYKGADLNRVKLCLEIKGITVVSDEKDIVKNALAKFNETRKSKKEFEEENENDYIEKSKCEWINILLEKVKTLGDDGVFKYMFEVLQMKGYEPQKIWKKDEKIYRETLYMRWNMKFMVINSLGIKMLSDKEFCDGIYNGKFLNEKAG